MQCIFATAVTKIFFVFTGGATPDMWCVHGHDIRTNNDLESWHASMRKSIPRQHPDIFTFLNWMKEEEDFSRNVIAQLDAGVEMKRKNKLYVTINARITALTNDYTA